MRISDWSSDLCSSDLFYWYIGPETSTIHEAGSRPLAKLFSHILQRPIKIAPGDTGSGPCIGLCQSDGKILTLAHGRRWAQASAGVIIDAGLASGTTTGYRSEEHTSELQSLMRSSYAVFCLKKKNIKNHIADTE